MSSYTYFVKLRIVETLIVEEAGVSRNGITILYRWSILFLVHDPVSSSESYENHEEEQGVEDVSSSNIVLEKHRKLFNEWWHSVS